MYSLEQQSLINTMKSLNAEEQAIAIKMFKSDLLWDELKRRDQIKRNALIKVQEALREEVK